MASPCTGTVVLATLPQMVGYGGNAALVELEMDFTVGSEGVAFDWIGPYGGGPLARRDHLGRLNANTKFQFALIDWTTSVAAGTVRHSMTFAWPAGALPGIEAGIRFRADDGACPGEPAVVCTEKNCELRSGNGELAGTTLHRR